MKTQLGEVDIRVLRDHKGEFEPKIIAKYYRNAEGMEEKILSLYAYGMSQREGHRGANQEPVRCGNLARAGEQNQREDYAGGDGVAEPAAGKSVSVHLH